MLRKLKLYGELAEFVGHKEFEVKADSIGKVVSFLINNFPQVERYMNPKYYQVKVGNYEVDKTEIHYPIGQEDIHIVPVIAGAGRGVGKVLLGAALIGLAIAAPGAGFSFGSKGVGFIATGAAPSAFMAAVGNLGIALTLMGVSEMLFPVPKPKEFRSEEDPRLSFSFSGAQNTSRAGTPVPLVYGTMITGSVVISGAVDTQQVQA
jgi:predicted phage tail protein